VFEPDVPGRSGRARAAIDAGRDDIDRWFVDRDAAADPAYGRFERHFATVREVLVQMIARITSTLSDVTASMSSGEVYERCRAIEQRVAKVSRTFEWYGSKYDQRLDARDRPVLEAADQVVLSCWVPPFRNLGRPVPTAPLCYLDERWDAAATPRLTPPADLPTADAVIGTLLHTLPVPVIALPARCRDEPWWLVMIAHEVGHHVQFDLDMVAPTEQALRLAVTPLAPELAGDWVRWSMESFADAWSVLAVGGAAAWAVADFAHAPIERLIAPIAPGGRYPPPLIREALLAELGRTIGVDDPGIGIDGVGALLDAADVNVAGLDEHRAHLDVVKAVSDALLDLQIDGVPLPQLLDGGAHLAAGAESATWAVALGQQDPHIQPIGEAWSARTLAAAGVRAAADATRAGDGAAVAAVGQRLVDAVRRAGEGGHLADDEAPKLGAAEVSQLADSLLAALDHALDDALGGS